MARALRRIAVGVGAVTALALAVGLLPATRFPAHRAPTLDYAQALAGIAALQAEDGPEIAGGCGTRLLTHGGRTAHVVVLLHGLTNCPAQFDSLGRIAFMRGANVLIPRLPGHGRAERMTDALARADARVLVAFTDRVLDAARGLGDTLTVAGLSVGGTLAAWAAQERPDVDRAVVIAPMLGVALCPAVLTPLLRRLAGAAPNLFVWWDPKRREALGGPRHVYPRFATRAVAATLEVGAAVEASAHRAPRAAPRVWVVTVGGDPAVHNGMIASLVRTWASHGRATETYTFPESLHLNHDVVDPEQVGGDPHVTYPVLSGRIGP